MDEVEDKNPKMDNGWTPLHLAVKYGHEEVFKMIQENCRIVLNKKRNAENNRNINKNEFSASTKKQKKIQGYRDTIKSRNSVKDEFSGVNKNSVNSTMIQESENPDIHCFKRRDDDSEKSS